MVLHLWRWARYGCTEDIICNDWAEKGEGIPPHQTADGSCLAPQNPTSELAPLDTMPDTRP